MWIDAWSEEPGVDWASLYDPAFPIGNIINSDTYELDSDIRKLSDTEGDVIRIYHTNGVQYSDYDLVDADKLKDYYRGQNKEFPNGNYAAQFGRNLVFNHKFISTNPQFGGTIKVPAYLYPSHLVNDNDEVPVDIPNWLVLVTAAELASNDVTKQQLVPLLQAQANEVMTRMIDNNDGQIDQVSMEWRPRARTWT